MKSSKKPAKTARATKTAATAKAKTRVGATKPALLSKAAKPVKPAKLELKPGVKREGCAMGDKARADYIMRKLSELYPDPPVPLDHTDAYTLLIAVLLSAQCTDKRVNLTTPTLFAKARTPQTMMKVPVEEIQSIIRPCGLSPAKAKAIAGLSKILVEEHGGNVPSSLEDLEKLPGVGHKTAQVVMAQAFGVPSFPVDTHIHRLAHRWGLSDGKSVIQTERDLKALFPESSWNKLHLQIIYYGREHCGARSCDGTKCEICRTLFPLRSPNHKPSSQQMVKTSDLVAAKSKKPARKSAPSAAKSGRSYR